MLSTLEFARAMAKNLSAELEEIRLWYEQYGAYPVEYTYERLQEWARWFSLSEQLSQEQNNEQRPECGQGAGDSPGLPDQPQGAGEAERPEPAGGSGDLRRGLEGVVDH